MEASTIAIIACVIALAAVAVSALSQYNSRKQITQMGRRLYEMNNEQEKKMGEIERMVASLRQEVVNECRNLTQEETSLLKKNLHDSLKEEDLLLNQLSEELIALQDKTAAEFDGMLTWRQELETTMGIQVENQGVFVDHVRTQLDEFAKHSRSLPDQLDTIAGKLEQIRRLKRELAEVQQPIQLDAWKDEHFTEEVASVTEGAV
ncbi:hypothetical protein [Candidatus Enterococcus leclercqii]|uniref:hypothetical protein n=1 Tax=Candidatus Enterococcus leclercqii TaxID=1857218 RepID=UPI001379C483|nr:hypothetical protein [Enterococcus sp. CU9D]KAF1294024.1 hypothetical protein BAU14_07560 [Enterococcus sp. CU9D]